MIADRLPLFTRFLADGRRALIGWSIAMVAMCLAYLPVFPLLGDELERMLADVPEALLGAFGVTTLADGAGYAHSTVFTLSGALLMIVAALGWGVRAVAGDEEAGTLELTLARAVTRTGLLVQRTAAVIVMIMTLALVVMLSVAALSGPSELELRVGNVVAAGAALGGLALLFGLIALAVGAATGRRGLALATGAGLAVAAYLADALGAQVTQLEVLRSASPFYWAYANDPLRNGLDAGGVGLLVGIAVLAVAVAGPAFARRDVGTAGRS